MCIQRAYLILFLLNVVNIILYSSLRFGKGREIFDFLAKQEENTPSWSIRHVLKKNLRPRIHQIVDGFTYGLICAPFLVYYADLKLNFYFDYVGYLLCAYFFLLGVGKEFMRFFACFPIVLRVFSLFGSIALAAVAFSSN